MNISYIVRPSAISIKKNPKRLTRKKKRKKKKRTINHFQIKNRSIPVRRPYNDPLFPETAIFLATLHLLFHADKTHGHGTVVGVAKTFPAGRSSRRTILSVFQNICRPVTKQTRHFVAGRVSDRATDEHCILLHDFVPVDRW